MRSIHNLQYSVRVKCTKCDKLYSPSGIHKCIGINPLEHGNLTDNENDSETTASECSSDDTFSEEEETIQAESLLNGERISIVCKEDDRVICPIDSCRSVS